MSVSQGFSVWHQCASCESDCYFWASVVEKCQESKSIFCVSYICFRGMWLQRQTSKKEVWIWPLNSLAEGKEAKSPLKDFISYRDKKLTSRCLSTRENVRFDCLFSRQITNLNLWRHKHNKCQGMKRCVQIVNSMKAQLLSSSSHLQALCFSHQQVWLSFWSPETVCKAAFLHPDSKKTESAFYSDPSSPFRLTETKFN